MNPMDGHNRRTSGREKGSNIPQKESAYGIVTEVTVFVSGQFKFHSCSVGLCIMLFTKGEKKRVIFFPSNSQLPKLYWFSLFGCFTNLKVASHCSSREISII